VRGGRHSKAEFERTILSHSQMADVWCKLALKCGNSHGAGAYGWKKRVMYSNLSKSCAAWFERGKKRKEGLGLYIYFVNVVKVHSTKLFHI
jgi:hypothetical protein